MRDKRLALSAWRLSAQEAERTRIARELHDNIGQSLSLLGIELDLVRSSLESPSAAGRLKTSSAKLREIAIAVSDLSHQIYSSELELLGLAAALMSLCEKFAESNKISTTCVCTGVPANVGKDLALTLFRVCEQTMECFAKRNGSTKVDLRLGGGDNYLKLTIAYNGTAPNASENARLAIADMKERMQLVGGRLTLRRGKSGETKIEAKASLA